MRKQFLSPWCDTTKKKKKNGITALRDLGRCVINRLWMYALSVRLQRFHKRFSSGFVRREWSTDLLLYKYLISTKYSRTKWHTRKPILVSVQALTSTQAAVREIGYYNHQKTIYVEEIIFWGKETAKNKIDIFMQIKITFILIYINPNLHL